MDVTPIVKRLQRINDAIRALNHLGQVERETFVHDPFLIAAAERQFQVAIQAALDIGSMLLAEHGESPPQTYGEIFDSLASAGILPADLARRLAPMARFRNVLVHLYLEVDPNRLYDYIHTQLDDLERFVQHIAHYLGEDKTSSLGSL